MNSDRPASAQELKYPPIRVDRSLAELDLNTLIMRSNPQHLAHEATSLEDSTYEVLDRPGDLSDDDGHTASVASTPDDMSVTLSETESEGDDDFADYHVGEASHLAESSTSNPLDAEVIAAGEDSTLTERPGLEDSESGFHFRLDEHPLEGGAVTEGYSVVKEFTPEQSASKVLEPYGCSEIRLSLAVGLANRFYPDRGSFRVLFVGQLDAWSEEGIKTSLLNALLASPGSSKSVMVHGQVMPYSPVLYTAHCTGVEIQTHKGSPKRTVFKLDGSERAELELSHDHRQDRWPDLAIFCYPKSSSTSLDVSDYVEARLACRRSAIPILDITDHRRFNEEQPGFKTLYDPLSLRVCVEGKKDSDFSKVDWLPVDVYTFMHLEPSDLNRHLAAISPWLQPIRKTTRSRNNIMQNLTGLIPSPLQHGFISLTSVDAPLRLGLVIVALIGMIAASYLGISFPQLKHNSATPAIIQSQVTSSLIHTPMSAATSTIRQAVIPVASAPSVKDKIDEFFAKQRDETEKAAETLRKMAENAEHIKVAAKLREKLEKRKTEMRRREEAAKSTKIGGFEIQSSGHHQFILRPSKDFTGRSRKPQLQIQVSRDSKNVPIRYERTIDGVYVVDLEEDYSVGSFNVSIATHSKPLMQQSFHIKLGHEKSRIEHWLSHLQRERAAVQHVLYDFSSDIVQQLHTISARLAEDSHEWRDKAEHSRRDAVDRVREATKEIDRQVLKVRDQTWSNLRQITAPVRTSRRTLWARNNAYVWRCGFERAVGLSSKDKYGKKTRSCQSANW